MNKVYGLLLIGLLVVACKEKTTKNKLVDNKVEFNQTLADELSKMVITDQLAAANAYPPKNYSHLTQEEWNSFKDSIYTTHQKRAKEILNEYGFAGFDLVGEEGSSDFWLIVQHSDHDPDFQKEVLEKMKIEVDEGNADSRIYGLLVDRVKLNTGEAQIYGTQVAYNMEICQAYPRKLADSINVNKRRKEIGLEPLEVYLNDMTKMNFKMNKEFFAKKGVTKPKLYLTQ
jgi:predicted TIM-barrel fold metal-dependent hydrolase